jgi:hypothetical protein
MPKTSTESKWTDLLEQIRIDYPELSFEESTHFSWHSNRKRVSFKKTGEADFGVWALLHELGHALLNHTDYNYDIELLQLEASAWEKAHHLAHKYSLEIDKNYAQDCLDTYRDWLHTRATCPTCLTRSLQTTPRQYRCFNCGAEWVVSRSRLCRPYRLQTA